MSKIIIEKALRAAVLNPMNRLFEHALQGGTEDRFTECMVPYLPNSDNQVNCAYPYGNDRIIDLVKFIGQPVKYESGSFLRIAIGSYDVRQYLKNEKVHFENDLNIIKIIENEVKNS